MPKAVIIDCLRSPIGKFQGALSPLSAPDLCAQVIQRLLAKYPDARPTEAILGNVLSAGVGQAPARQASLRGGMDVSSSALTINKVCGSGLKAIQLAASSVLLGDHEIVLAGGMESMSNAPYLLPKMRQGARMGHAQAIDSMMFDGLHCAMTDQAMGTTAELVAEKYKITRQMQDEYALNSHLKALHAMEHGYFKNEIVPIVIPGKKGSELIISEDEGPRKDTTFEKLQSLRAAFKKDGTVTAGNAPSVNDGASVGLITTQSHAFSLGIKPIATILGWATAGLEPQWVTMAPIPAVQKLMAKLGWTNEDVDLWEINEAFSVQLVATLNELKLDPSKVNVHGGAVALGHPIGASGSRVLSTLIYALKKTGGKRGIAALCLGGANAIAMAIEID
ncbi:MAG: thiolase family protein [Holophagaceae bacterium]